MQKIPIQLSPTDGKEQTLRLPIHFITWSIPNHSMVVILHVQLYFRHTDNILIHMKTSDPMIKTYYCSDKCKHPLTEKNGYLCSNVDCCDGTLSLFETSDPPELDRAELEYRIPVSLTDHTGSLEHCYLYGSVAEHLMGIKVRIIISDNSKINCN